MGHPTAATVCRLDNSLSLRLIPCLQHIPGRFVCCPVHGCPHHTPSPTAFTASQVLHDFLYYMQPQVLLAANDTTPPRLVRSLIPSNQTAPALAASNGVTLLTAVNCPLQMCGVAPKPICPAVFL